MKFITALVGSLLAMTMTSSAQAQQIDLQDLQTALLVQAEMRAGLNWMVGDRATYSVDMGGFIKGTSNNSVREDTGTALWLVQDMDLGFQKQKVEILINKSNGQIEKLLVNGKEQSIPKKDAEIVEMKEAHITVAAGSFDCIYAKIRDKSDGSISEAWINPKVVPMAGTLKAMADSQFGKVVQEVTSMQFAPRP